MAASAASLFDVSEMVNGEMWTAMRALNLLPMDLADPQASARTIRLARIFQMAGRVKLLCEELGIAVGDQSVMNIAATLMVDASANFPNGHPLNPRDRQVAEELVYQWMMSTFPGRESAPLRKSAAQRVAFGERGRTTLHWIGENILGFGR